MENQREQNIMAEEIWLNYFNNYLRERQIITEDQRRKMCSKIIHHCNRKRKQTTREQER